MFAVFVTFSQRQNIPPSEIEAVKVNKSHLDESDHSAIDQYGYMVINQSGMDLEFASLTLAVIKAESRFQHDAKSHKGAIGLMQLRPATAVYIGDKIGVKITKKDLLNPDINVRLGVSYIKYLEKRFKQIEDEDRRLTLVLASYNYGFHNVKRSFKCRGVQCFMDRANLSTAEQFDSVMGGLPQETQRYLKTVRSYLSNYRSVFNSA